jgi:5-methylcytosine-specific restriction endonuclease McrA
MKTATVDHLVPIAAGGIDRVENYILACYSCNLKKGCSVAPVATWMEDKL